MKDLSLTDVLVQDFWIHLAGLIVISIAALDLWYFHAFTHDTELLLLVGGLAGMGLRIVNGSAAALRSAALDTAFTAARAASAAADAAKAAAPPAQP